MSHTKVLFILVLFFSTVLLLLSSCAEKKVSPQEIPITTNSKEALELYLKGRDMYDNLKTPQAAELFDKAIALDKDFAMAYLYRAISGGGYKVFRENIAKAVGLLDKVSTGEKHMILYNNAETSQTQKAELDSLLALYPEDKYVQSLAGTYYYNLTDYPNALDYFERAAKIDSNYAACYNMLGYTHIGIGNYTAAEEAFQKYTQLIPDEANPYDSYAEFLLRQGRFDESIVQYNKALQTDPQFVSSLVGIGDNYTFKGDYNKAREYYQQYYDKSFNINQKVGALLFKAVSYIHEGKITEAIKTLDERAKLAFDNNYPTLGINSYRYASFIMEEKGNINEAEKYINKMAELTKSSDLTDAVRKSFEIVVDLDRCYLQILKKDLNGAEKTIGTLKPIIVSRNEPSEIEFLNFLNGFLQFNKGKSDLAIQYYQKTGEGNPYYWYCEALAQEKIGSKEAAKKLYAKIANYYVNSVSLALVRERAKSKM